MATARPTSAPPGVEYNDPISVAQERELTPTEIAEYKKQYRLGLPLGNRLVLGAISYTAVGFGLGAYYGARRDGLRFRAENAHRLPTSQRGWYFYHKSKNYAAMLGGVKEGARMGLKTGLWGAAFIWLEAAADHNRGYGGHQDFVSTTIAGVTAAALWSAWNRFPAATTVRTGLIGFKYGLGWGLAQDALGYARGREIKYIEYGKKMLGRSTKQEDND